MKKTFLMSLIALTGLATQAGANLIPLGAIPSTGNGIGAAFTSVTFQNTGLESGCVAYNGTTAVRGSAACPAGLGFTGGDETTAGAGNNIYTTADLGFSATRDFRNLVLIFNGNEGGGSLQTITLNSLGLSLYSSTGVRLVTFTTPSLPTTYSAFPGVGNAGFGFALDATQAAQANAFYAAAGANLLRIGTSANASNANDGPEAIQLNFLTNTGGGGGAVTPEPTTFVLLGSGLMLAIGRSFRRRRTE